MLDMDQFNVLMLILTVLYGVLSLAVTWHCVVIVRLVRYIARSHNRDCVQNFLYILALTVVDAIVLTHLPLLCIELLNKQWIFGLALCRIFWIAESVNKILSTFILTALCFDRYLAVCWSSRSRSCSLRTPKIAWCLITGCAVLAFTLLSPFYVNASVDEIPVTENETVTKCIIEWSSDTEHTYTIFLFVFGYCMPVLLMIYFYCRIIWYLKKRGLVLFGDATQQSLARRRIRTRVVTRRSFALVLFYFVCWTPFWIFTFAVDPYSDLADVTIIVFYFSHSLVYLNSAMNPMFYAVLNRELWSRKSRKKSTRTPQCQHNCRNYEQTSTQIRHNSYTNAPTLDEPDTEF